MKFVEKHIDYIIYGVVTTILFIECVWLHYSCTHSIWIASLYKNPLAFFGFYLPKLFISMLIASSVFFMKHKWSILIYLFVLNIWFLANCVYFRSYGNFIDVFAVTMAGNMDGFWDAVFLFVEKSDMFYFLSVVIFVVVLLFLPHIPRRNWKLGIVSFVISYILCGFVVIIPHYYYHTRFSTDQSDVQYQLPPVYTYFIPFSKDARTIGLGISLEHDFSVLHYLGFDAVDYVSVLKDRKNPYVMTEQDILLLQPLLGSDTCMWNGSKQIIIIVESLESWAIVPEAMPAVSNLLQNSSFYAPYCSSQVKAGGSADGQMIINTGLLPIKEDAVCFRFPQNTFPSYPKGKSAVLIPHPITVWNQVYMSSAYGFDTTFISAAEDIQLFTKALDILDSGYDMVQVVTLTSHAPFKEGTSTDISLPAGLPQTLHDYLGCLHLTDAGIGLLIDRILSDSSHVNTTILITGDHTIFPENKRKQYASKCLEYNIHYKVLEDFVPFIIISPSIKERTLYLDTCYQMDIYPTMMHAMGYYHHYWSGVGMNLLDSERTERYLDEASAYELSDKLIRANYFNSVELKND